MMAWMTWFETWWLRTGFLVLAGFSLTFMFASSPLRYAQPVQTGEHAKALESPLKDLVQLELQKAIDEIKLKMEQQDTWYHYKFIFIGAMLALLVGQLGLGKDELAKLSGKLFSSLRNIDSVYLALALACVIALVIGMHIRNNMFGVQTIGLWIANYAEPAYLPNGSVETYHPWEMYLRRPTPAVAGDDTMYRLAFSLHLHFVTTTIYLLFMLVLQEVCLARRGGGGVPGGQLGSEQTPGDDRRKRLLLGFIFVQVASFSFVFVAHAVPSTYVKAWVPFGIYKNGWPSVICYLIWWAVVVILNVPYLLMLNKRRPPTAGAAAKSK